MTELRTYLVLVSLEKHGELSKPMTAELAIGRMIERWSCERLHQIFSADRGHTTGRVFQTTLVASEMLDEFVNHEDVGEKDRMFIVELGTDWDGSGFDSALRFIGGVSDVRQ